MRTILPGRCLGPCISSRVVFSRNAQFRRRRRCCCRSCCADIFVQGNGPGSPGSRLTFSGCLDLLCNVSPRPRLTLDGMRCRQTLSRIAIEYEYACLNCVSGCSRVLMSALASSPFQPIRYYSVLSQVSSIFFINHPVIWRALDQPPPKKEAFMTTMAVA